MVKRLIKTKFNSVNGQVLDCAEVRVTKQKELIELVAQLRSRKISRAERMII